MSSIPFEKKNFDKKQKKHKITTINLDITSSSSSSSSYSSNNSPSKKTKEIINNNNYNDNDNDNESSPIKIKKLFSDSDEDGDEEEKNLKNKKEDEDLAYNFEKALNKNQFLGEKGQMLLKLQNSYVNDSRFKLDSKFKNDINYNKLPSDLKDFKKHDLFNYDEIDKEAKDEDIELEKKKNMSILAELLPNSAFLEHKSLYKPTNELIIKRFDPKLNLGNASVDAIKVEKKKKKEKEKNIIKLEKGLQIFNEKNDMELYNQYNDLQKMKKRDKEKLYNETINKINDEMNQEIIVNYNSWKKGILDKNDNNFSLFGENNTNINKDNNDNGFSLFNDNKEEDKAGEGGKHDVLNNGNNIDNDNDKDKNEKDILKKKKKREKEKLKKKEKERIKKEKIKKRKEKIKKKMENINKEYEDYLIEEFGEEKANNHLRYIDMIQKFKKNQK